MAQPILLRGGAAVDDEAGAGHETGIVRGEEDDAFGDVCYRPHAGDRDAGQRILASRFEKYLNYLNNNQRRFIVPPGRDPLQWFVENRYGVVGTPEDAIALIERLQAKQGEFGVFLQQAHNWADWEETKRSYELYARYVMPHFSRDNRPRIESYDWCTDHRDELSEKRTAAARAMFDKHEAEQRAARASKEPAATNRPPRGREAW